VTPPDRKHRPPRAPRRVSWALPGLLLFVPACGGDDGAPPPAGPPVSLDCSHLAMGSPRTGGSFACAACVRHWRWALPEPGGDFFLLLELSCRDADDARLLLQDPLGATVWTEPVLPGDDRVLCVPHRPALPGTYGLVLAGGGPGGLTRFSGSLWINAFDGQGERLSPLAGGQRP